MPTLPRRCFVGFVLGAIAFAAGWWGARMDGAKARSGIADTRIEVAAAETWRGENRRLREANVRLQGELARAQQSPAAAAPAAPEPAQAVAPPQRSLAELLRDKGVGVRLKILAPGGRIDPGFAEAFGVQPGEVAQLEAALTEAKQAAEDLIRANMRIETTTLENGAASKLMTYTVTVAPFEGGREVYANLLQRFQATLGPDRGALFSTLEDEQLTRYLSHYGAEERKVRLSQSPDRAGIPWMIFVNEEVGRDTEQAHSFTFRTRSLEALKAEYGVLMDYLPEGFGPQK